jgi:Spy/CpxP family protein refolding chaperone
MIMKKLILPLLAVSLISTAVMAGGPEHKSHKEHMRGERDASMMVDRMAKKLDLSEAQKKEMNAIFEDTKKDIDALDKKYKMEAYRAERKKLREASKEKMDKVLNAEQKAKLDKMREKREKKFNKEYKKDFKKDKKKEMSDS